MPFVDLDPAPPNPAKESRPLVVALGQKRVLLVRPLPTQKSIGMGKTRIAR